MLTPPEARILGVLIEKSLTTPGQYPMTPNALVNGANQKSNRAPVLTMSEDEVLDTLDGLRAKDLVREVMMSGSRVQKFRHVARETLELSTPALVVLAELMLRGPQTVGEIRGRASRMHPLESTEVVQNVLNHLASQETPFVTRLAPMPGSRAERWAQTLAPNAHPLDAAPASAAVSPASGGSGDLEARVAALESEVAALRSSIEQLMRDSGPG